MTKILQLNSIINKNKNKKSWNNSTKREYENNHNDVQTCTINSVYCMKKKERKKDSIPNICLAYKIVITILTIIAFA